jgi:hypothetical protein
MVTLLGFFGDRQNENEGYEEALERLRRDTFGRLLRRLGKIVSLPVDFEKSLRQAHERRNWLTHMFFWERRVEFHSSSGRAQMMEELAQVEAEMRELNKLVHLVALKYLAAVGDPDPSVDERIRCLEEERELRIL